MLWFMGWQRVGHNGATELLLLGRKVITNLDSILKSREITLLTLSLLQWIFLTQESNQSLLHCSQILYQLSYQGSCGHSCNLNVSLERNMKMFK